MLEKAQGKGTAAGPCQDRCDDIRSKPRCIPFIHSFAEKGGVSMNRKGRIGSGRSINREPGTEVVLLAFIVCILAMTLGVFGCSSSGGIDQAEGDGLVMIGLTDREGDFVSYMVDVVALSLVRKDGVVVDTLPVRTRFDFARYTEMTEFLTAATVPAGLYEKVTLTLDYQDAGIWVENSQGKPVKAGSIQDVYGNEVTTLELAVHLAGRKALPVAPGIPAHLTLDFDLSASNRVAFGPGGLPVVTVRPFLLAEVNPSAPKIHRLRGPLTKVDVDAGVFKVMIRPFAHPLPGKHNRFGSLTVVTNARTLFDHSGESFQGRAGLLAMRDLTPFTATVVMGDLRFNPYRFLAREVRTGSSVPGGTLDVVSGNVTQREGDVLAVQGATLIRVDGTMIFNDTATVLLGDDTIVRKQLSHEACDTGDISVGQRLVAAGHLTGDDPGDLELDAAGGHVQMEMTALHGTVAEMESDLVLDLHAIDGRRVDIFDFSGTGTDPENDTDPGHYEVDTGDLDLSDLATDTPVKALGFVSPYGQAPSDFEAWSIVNVLAVPALMTVGWDPASASALEDVSSDGITLDLEGVGPFHYVDRNGVLTDLLDLAESPAIEPFPEGPGVYEIIQAGTRSIHTSFEVFASDLAGRIEGGGLVKHLLAAGIFDDATAVMTAGRVIVEIF